MSLLVKPFATKLVAFMIVTATELEKIEGKTDDLRREDNTVARMLRVLASIIKAVAEV